MVVARRNSCGPHLLYAICSASLVGQAVSAGGSHANRRGGALQTGIEGAVCLLAGANNRALALEATTNRERNEGCAGTSVADGHGASSAAIVVVRALRNGAVLDQGKVDGRHDVLLEESTQIVKTPQECMFYFEKHIALFFLRNINENRVSPPKNVHVITIKSNRLFASG